MKLLAIGVYRFFAMTGRVLGWFRSKGSDEPGLRLKRRSEYWLDLLQHPASDHVRHLQFESLACESDLLDLDSVSIPECRELMAYVIRESFTNESARHSLRIQILAPGLSLFVRLVSSASEQGISILRFEFSKGFDVAKQMEENRLARKRFRKDDKNALDENITAQNVESFLVTSYNQTNNEWSKEGEIPGCIQLTTYGAILMAQEVGVPMLQQLRKEEDMEPVHAQIRFVSDKIVEVVIEQSLIEVA